MREDLFMLFKLLQNTSATQYVIKVLQLRECDISKLRSHLSTARVSQFDMMT